MEPVKRIEIVVDSPEVPELLQLLRREGIGGYTVFGHLRGGGDRGERRDDEPSGGGNACVLVAVPAVDRLPGLGQDEEVLRLTPPCHVVTGRGLFGNKFQ